MNRGCVIALVIVALIVGIPAACGVGSYNGLVAQDEAVTAAWGQIDNMYKRRADLVPQLVATVKGAADFESSTLEAVVEARASVGRAQLPEGLPSDPAQLEQYMAAQRGLSGALGRLFALSENYPQLKATAGFLDLQAQLEGNENRIATARTDFIQAVQKYNTTRRKFPGNLIAAAFGMEARPSLQFEDAEANQQVPTIDFDGKDG